MICDCCKQEKIDCSLQPTRSQLLFGGFRDRIMEQRCEDCEKKVNEWIQKLLDNKNGTMC